MHAATATMAAGRCTTQDTSTANDNNALTPASALPPKALKGLAKPGWRLRRTMNAAMTH